MKFKQLIEYITIIFISLFGFLAFCFIFIYLARFSFQWYIFERVAETFYYRILAILFGGIVLLSVVNFIINISIFTKTYFLKTVGKLESEISFDTKKLLLKTIISSSAIIAVILCSLFILHLSNKHEYHEMMKNKIINFKDHNKSILLNILNNYSMRTNASQMNIDYKSLKTENYKISILIPLIDKNKKIHYRKIEDPTIPSDDRKYITEAMAFNDFFNIESKYFSNYEPSTSDIDIFNKIIKNKIDYPIVDSLYYRFTVIYPIYKKNEFILIYLHKDFGEDKAIYFNF
jgi:hypothetical protein